MVDAMETSAGWTTVDHWGSVKLASSARLFVYGAAILAALVACSKCGVGTRSFLICLAFAGIAYLLAVRELFQTQSFPRYVVFTCLALSALWRIAFLMTPTGQDDDIHRYVWDGRLQRLGYNPYRVVPSDPEVARLHTPDTRALNHPELPSPYPAGAQLFFRIVTSVHESIFAFKVAFLVCDLAIVLLLIDLLRRSGHAEHWVLAYAWHPLLAMNAAGSGHIDILGVLMLVLSAAALARRWRMAAAIAFTLAIAVKFLPIVLLPLYWRRVRVRDGLAAAFVFTLLYLPFLHWGQLPTGSLGAYVQSFRFNDPFFAVLERFAAPQFAAGLALLVGIVTAVCLSRKPLVADTWAWPMAASLACAPVIYPWYLIWLLPFLRSTSTLPIMIWTASILPTYVVWHLRAIGQTWQVPGWVLLLEYGSVAITAVVLLLRRKKTIGSATAPAQVLPASSGMGAESANNK